MSIVIRTKAEKTYPIANPAVKQLKNTKLGFNKCVDILNDKKSDADSKQFAIDQIRPAFPNFKNKPRQITKINIHYDERIANAEKEFDGAIFKYSYPSYPEIYALNSKLSVNGKPDPSIWDLSTQDTNRVMVMGYMAAELFITNWEGLDAFDEEGNPVEFPYSRENIERLPSDLVGAFGIDIMLPYIVETLFGKDSADKGQEEDPIPN